MGIFKGKRLLVTNQIIISYEGQRIEKTIGILPHLENFEFNWGNEGYGQEHLALVILLKIYNQETAIKFYKPFAEEHIFTINSKKWVIDDNTVKSWLSSFIKNGFINNLINKVCIELNITRRNISLIFNVTKETVDVWARSDSNINHIAKKALNLLLENHKYKVKLQRIRENIKKMKNTKVNY